jgi:hypothetical protein
MKKILFIALWLTPIIHQGVFAQSADDSLKIQAIREEGMKDSKVMELAFNMTDIAGPRLAGSPGLRRAQEYAISKLKSWGLVNVNLEPWGKFGKGWEVQKNYSAMVEPYYHALVAIPKAWTPSTPGPIKAEVVYVKADSISDLDQYKGKLRGKILIRDTRGSVEMNFSKPNAYRFTEDSLYQMSQAKIQGDNRGGGRRGFAALMKFRNALAEFELNEGVALVLTQARGTDGTVFTTNGASYRDTAKAVVPELETSGEDFQRILRLAKAGQKVVIEADIKTEYFTQDLNGYNVVGEIPGTDKKLKDQLVMLGGHLDSWHAATGATDNAAGSAVMLEVLRIIKATGLKPKRTIRIALWSSEEQGLFGSRNYVLNHFGDPATMILKPEQAKVSAYYNLDNGTGKIRGVYLQGNSEVAPLFQSWLSPFKSLGANTLTLSNTGGTDHLSFDAVGIPGFQFIQDPMDYETRTHHSNQDTYDKLSEEDLKEAAVIVASFVYKTANLDQMIPRKPLPKVLPRTGQ